MKKEMSFISNLILLAFEITGITISIIENGGMDISNYINIANIFMFFSALNYLASFHYKEKRFKRFVDYIKLTSTTALAFSFLTVVLFMASESSLGYLYYLFHGSYLWIHFLCPGVAIISFIFLEQYEFKYLKGSLIALVFTLIYAV